jgi:hypothetical protein
MKSNARIEPNKIQRTMRKSRFLLGFLCVLAAIVGAFVHLPWFYFAVLFAGGCGLMGQKSIWEKMAAIIRGK